MTKTKPPIHFKKTLDHLLLKALPELRKVYAQTWFELVRPDQKLERRRLAKDLLAKQVETHQESLEALDVLFNKAPYFQRQRIITYRKTVSPLLKSATKMLSMSPYTVSQ